MKAALGWLLVALSFAPWAVYAALPFVPVAPDTAALVATTAFVAGQVAFVTGLALVGRDAFVKIKNRFRCCGSAQ
jgi:hypothetical protein